MTTMYPIKNLIPSLDDKPIRYDIGEKKVFNTYEEYILEDIINTKESLIKQGEQKVDLFLNQILTNDSKVKSKNVEIENVNDGIIYKVTVIVEENIGKFLKTGDK